MSRILLDMIFSNIIKTSINVVSKRFMRKRPALKSWPNDWVPFVWKRPEKTPGYFDSGDLIDLGKPSKEDLLPEVRKSELLKSLDVNNPLRKIFSLDHGKVSQFNKALVHNQLKKLGLIHEIDYPNSLEAKIVNLTYALRHSQGQIKQDGETNRYKNHVRTFANSCQSKRYRYLCELKELHGDRYKRLIKALQIEPQNNLINAPLVRPYRKAQMRSLAIDYARDLKEKKVNDYMKSLEKEQAEFEKEKKETLKWIEEQEKKLGFTV